MTRDELEALIERDELDIIDILQCTMKQVSDFDTLITSLMQLRSLYAVGYLVCNNVVNVVAGWQADVEQEPEEEKYDA